MPHALITGANRGIGLGHTRALLDRGWTVHAAVRDPDGADALRGLQTGDHDGELKLYAYDAREADAAQKLAKEITEPLDILFANAGVMGPKQQGFGEVEPDGFLDTMNINVMGPLSLAQAFADQIRLSEAAGEGDPDRADADLAAAATFERPRFPVSGRDLLKAGFAPGPELGARLTALQEHWIDSGFELDRDALIALARSEE